MTLELSIIILNFNTKEYLRKCLTSVFSSKQVDFKAIEVIVVDNNSSDGSVEMLNKYFTQVKLIKNKENVGFSAGNNIGIRKSNGRLILLLNSDVEVGSNTIQAMMEYFNSNANVGAASCRLNLPTGQIDPASHRGFPTPLSALFYLSGLEKLFSKFKFFGGYHQGWKDFSVPHQVDVISGAFLLTSKQVIKKVGLLDEQFFMYGEDIDWCYRMRQAGYKIIFNPLVTAVHHKRQSGRDRRDEGRRTRAEGKKLAKYHFVHSMEQFYRKHYMDKYPKFISYPVVAALKLWKILT